MDVKLTSIVVAAVGIVLVSIILSTVTWKVQEAETYFTSQPYAYEQTFVRENHVWKLCCPWFSRVTQVQHIVKNADEKAGEFLLNYVFDNGVDVRTSTKKVVIQSGEEKAVSVDSPLGGHSDVTLKVIPPMKAIPQERTVEKQVNGWTYFGRFVFHFR